MPIGEQRIPLYLYQARFVLDTASHLKYLSQPIHSLHGL